MITLLIGKEDAAHLGRSNSQVRSDLVFFYAVDQVRIFFDKIIVPVFGGILAEADFLGLFFQNPMTFHIANIKGCNVFVSFCEIFKLRKIVFPGNRVFDSLNAGYAGRFA